MRTAPLEETAVTATTYDSLYQRSIDPATRDAYWADQALRIDWHKPATTICDYSQPPFAKWFAGGETNLCHNAIDRHIATRAQQAALIYVSTETNQEHSYTYAELHQEVQCMAASLIELGVGKGDRVLIYMPMIAEAVFAMLACVRIGAIHSVVFGGFASVSLASRIEDATPSVIVSADAGSRSGKVMAYKPLLDEAIGLSQHKPSKVLLIDRQLATMQRTAIDVDYTTLRDKHAHAQVPCVWVDATHPSYTLYTSGTTGKPKGVQRDTGGYAVALAASMPQIFQCQPGETYFCSSDIGWVVGHSYIVYGPLINGSTTILYEGLPVRPDAGIWWSLVEKYKVTAMFSSPTAVRVLKKHDAALLKKYDLSSLKALYLAGEPLDEPTAKWISEGLGKPIIDNYWQTESGWPILTIANGIAKAPSKFGSPGIPMPGYKVQLVSEQTGEALNEAQQKGVLTIEGPLPPGCMQTVWRDDARFVKTYWQSIPGKLAYSTFDWAAKDEDGYYFILGRTDDVINVAGHRLGTREIEESISSHTAIAEVAVVGVADPLKGQVAMAFAVVKDPARTTTPALRLALEGEVMKTVDTQLGAVARPSRVHFVNVLPKTRSGKLLRRVIQAVCEGRDPGDLTTIEDPMAIEQLRVCVDK
jgi:propionyl-CoA synthetase